VYTAGGRDLKIRWDRDTKFDCFICESSFNDQIVDNYLIGVFQLDSVSQRLKTFLELISAHGTVVQETGFSPIKLVISFMSLCM